MFDTNMTITQPVRTAAAGKQDITVRWPTDDEWVSHRKRRKVLQRSMGRGQTVIEVDSADASARLYEVIKQNGAPPLTVGEAMHVIDNISVCDATGVELGADQAEVQLVIVTGAVKHTVKIPTLDQVRELQRSTQFITLPYGAQEIRPSLGAAARLWDACGGQAEGYTGPVPNVHKDAAIRAVIQALEQEASAKTGEESF